MENYILFFFLFLVLFVFWLRQVECGILIPHPGMEPVAPAMEAQSPNHWTTR